MRITSVVFGGIALLSALSGLAAAVIIQPVGVTADTTNDFFSVSNLIGGSGLTGDNPPEHIFNYDLWVTQGAPTWYDHYFNYHGAAHLVFDLGEDTDIGSIYIWPFAYSTGYHAPNTYQGNTLRDFELRFHTEAGGSPPFNPGRTPPDFVGIADHGCPLVTGEPAWDDTVERQDIAFGSIFHARYVHMTITSNYFAFPGSAGGDRLGASEIWFDTEVVPEPSTLLLLGLGSAMVRRRR